MGIKAWPSIIIYKNGLLAEEFKGTRDYVRLKDFIEKHAEPSSGTLSAESSATTALQVQSSQVVNPRGAVLVLDDSNFQRAVDQGPLFVKFYAPW